MALGDIQATVQQNVPLKRGAVVLDEVVILGDTAKELVEVAIAFAAESVLQAGIAKRSHQP